MDDDDNRTREKNIVDLNSIITEDVHLRKSDSSQRWVVLVLNIIIMVGVYYAFDFPAPMKTQIADYMGNPSDFETMFSLLYTVTAMPNIILPYFGGYFVDTLGAAKCMVVFMSLMACGGAVFALGLSLKSWPVMFLGRGVFGLGLTSNSVGNSTILVDWFGGKEVSFAFGLCLALSRMASVVNNISSPLLAHLGGVVFSCWCGVFLLIAGVICAIAVYPMDILMESVVEANLDEQKRLLASHNGIYNPAVADLAFDASSSSHSRGVSFDDRTRGVSAEGVAPALLNTAAVNASETESDTHSEIRLSKALEFPLQYRLLTAMCLLIYGIISPFNNIASSLLLERSYFMTPPSDCLLNMPNSCQNSTNKPSDECPSSKYYQYPLPINIAYNGKYYKKMTADDVDCTSEDWSDGCAKQFCNRLDDSIIEANTVMSIPYFMAAIFLPFLGSLVDRVGLRALILLLVPICLFVVHALLGLTRINPIGLLVGQGLGYTCMAATLWPSFSLLVEKKYTGVAFGVAFCMQNVGLTLFPFIIAMIYQGSDNEYIPNVELFFMSISAVCIVIGIWVNYIDLISGSVLNSPTRAEPTAASVDPTSNGDERDLYSPLYKTEGD